MIKNTLLLTLVLASGSTAFGQLYFGAGVGYFFPETDDTLFEGSAGSGPEDGVGLIANVGYKVPSNGWHFELDFQYFQPDSSFSAQATGAQSAAATGTNLGTGTYGVKGDIDNYTFLAQVYYDVLATMETNWGIYFGGGLGATYIDQTVRVTGPAGSVSDSDDAWLFTYQIMAGISYNPVEHIRFDLAYRYTVPEDENVSIFNQNGRLDGYEFESIEFSASFLF